METCNFKIHWYNIFYSDLHKLYLTHESSGEVLVSSDFAVDFDQSLHGDLLYFIICQGILKTVPQEHNEGERFPQLVGSSAGSGGLQKPKKRSNCQPPLHN